MKINSMKKLMIIVTVFILEACSTKPIIISPPKHPEKGLKTPVLILPQNADKDMLQAASVFGQYANSDEFYDFVRNNVSSLDGGNETDVSSAITKFRSCLNERGPVKIEYRIYTLKNRGIVIGGWRKTYLAQNQFKELDVIARASHWIHEISHACGFTHVENDIRAYPVIKQSWPYVIGSTFKEFLSSKTVSSF